MIEWLIIAYQVGILLSFFAFSLDDPSLPNTNAVWALFWPATWFCIGLAALQILKTKLFRALRNRLYSETRR